MRALTVKQPWGSLIIAGAKDVENRSWPVPAALLTPDPCPAGCGCVRGDDPDRRDCGCDGPCCMDIDWPEGRIPFRLAIHAGKTFDESVFLDSFVVKAMLDAGLNDAASIPMGVLLGYVTVTGCHYSADCTKANTDGPGVHRCSPWANAGAYHWTLADPEPLPEPIPMRGRQGLWTLPESVPA